MTANEIIDRIGRDNHNIAEMLQEVAGDDSGNNGDYVRGLTFALWQTGVITKEERDILRYNEYIRR